MQILPAGRQTSPSRSGFFLFGGGGGVGGVSTVGQELLAVTTPCSTDTLPPEL